jgi:hypothetical protein
MIKNWGFEGWRALCQTCCALLLVFSFITESKIGAFSYALLIVSDILGIVFTACMMMHCKGKNKL